MQVAGFLLLLTAVIYALAFLFHLASFLEWRENGRQTAALLVRLGFLISTFYFAAEALAQGFFLPVANFSQALAFFAWSLNFVYLVLIARAGSESFGLILSPVLFFLVLAAASVTGAAPSESMKPLLRNPFFMIHITSAFFAYASFTLSFSAGVLYLIQHRALKAKRAGRFYHKLPPLEDLETLVYQPLLWGAPLLVAAFLVGLFWSKSAFGVFWIFDPKTIATLATAVFYLVILYLRGISSVRGKQVAVLSLAAYALLVFSFIGVRFLEGSHSAIQ